MAKFNLMNPFGIKNPKLAKALWVSIIAAILTALGIAVVGIGNTNLFSGLFGAGLLGISAAVLGSFVGLGVFYVLHDYLKHGKVYWVDAAVGSLGSVVVLLVAAGPLGIVFAFSNLFGWLIGVAALTVGGWIGIEAGEYIK